MPYVVSPNHIGYLLDAALVFAHYKATPVRGKEHETLKFSWQGPDGVATLTPDNREEVGQVLWATNIQSYNTFHGVEEGGHYHKFRKDGVYDFSLARYKALDFTPGRMGLGFLDDGYKRAMLMGQMPPHFSLAQVFKALDAYAVECTQTPDWPRSYAHSFVDALRLLATRLTPGYDQAHWGCPDDAVLTEWYQ